MEKDYIIDECLVALKEIEEECFNPHTMKMCMDASSKIRGMRSQVFTDHAAKKQDIEKFKNKIKSAHSVFMDSVLKEVLADGCQGHGACVDKYQTEAQRTSSYDKEKVAERMCDNERIVSHLLTNIINTSYNAKRNKNHFYYGRIPKKQSNPHVTVVDSDPCKELERISNDNIISLLHCIFGLQDEIGELAEQVYDHIFRGADLDLVNVKEELGDLSWYIRAEGTEGSGFNFSEILDSNTKKLEKRFPKGFTEHDANERDLELERKVLEQSSL